MDDERVGVGVGVGADVGAGTRSRMSLFNKKVVFNHAPPLMKITDKNNFFIILYFLHRYRYVKCILKIKIRISGHHVRL